MTFARYLLVVGSSGDSTRSLDLVKSGAAPMARTIVLVRA
jgi:hypothetical protein